MILKNDGSLWSCGLNSDYQLGINLYMHDSDNFEKAIPSGVKSVAAGHSHSIALKSDDTVWATGKNSYGQLGDGTTSDRDHFSSVQLFRGATAVSAGGWHSMVLTAAGDVWVTGWNEYGQLGLDSTVDEASLSFSSKWKQVIADTKAIAAGHLHSIVLKQDGSVWAAGRNDYGQLGDGSNYDSKTFVQAQGFDGMMVSAIAVAAGGYHSILLARDGTVMTTGWNYCGQLGDDEGKDRDIFQAVFSGAKAISAGTRHSMILTNEGSVLTSGLNMEGELGTGTTVTKFRFVEVIPDGVEAIAAGGHHSMALKKDGSVWATGSNKYGQIGDGSEYSTETFVRATLIRDGALQYSVFDQRFDVVKPTLLSLFFTEIIALNLIPIVICTTPNS